MEIDHLHFYVDDLERWQQWFSQRCACELWGNGEDAATRRRLLALGQVPLLLSAPRHDESPVARYLRQHPPGLADVAFRVTDVQAAVRRYGTAAASAGKPLTASVQPSDQEPGLRWCQVAGWGSVRHTLIERQASKPCFPGIRLVDNPRLPQLDVTAIDHAVLNVQTGDLARAVDWYERHFGFCRTQMFNIATSYSGLQSQVLVHPDGTATLPINQPATANSQVQEFLTYNRGTGVQHVALRSADILQDVARLKALGLTFLSVPSTYYQTLTQRSGYCAQGLDWAAIAQTQILVDWSPEAPQARLLQTFTQPIFDQPTFFFEVIERQTIWQKQQKTTAQGFGEGNFRALFEAIEREQMKRGSLDASGCA
jgi:4-hydroxyphenylpyruvate dioxygenase